MVASEPRIITETGIEARIAGMIEPLIHDLGFQLVRIKLMTINGQTLQIMAERPDRSMTIHDCEVLSRALSPQLDMDDPIVGGYHLEISSPGMDRPLVRRCDFETWLGHMIKCETHVLTNGRKRYKGMIIGFDGSAVRLRCKNSGTQGDEDFVLDIRDLAEARLILDDRLIRESLQWNRSVSNEKKLEVQGGQETDLKQ